MDAAQYHEIQQVVLDRPLMSLGPHMYKLARYVSQVGTPVHGWDPEGADSLDVYCRLNGVDPARAVFIGSTEPKEKVVFALTFDVETEDDLERVFMTLLEKL